MIRLVNLKRQHITILEEINFIDTEIRKERSLISIQDLALHINTLAGKIKIHMMEEDNYLYPDLLQNQDTQIVDMTKRYIGEMGNLAAEYIIFKNSYNVANKIKGNIDTFLKDTENMMEILKKRMDKEDNELYKIVEDQKL